MKGSKKSQKKLEEDDGDISEAYLNKLLQHPELWTRVKFERRPKNKTITLRLSDQLLAAVKEKAAKEGIDYQKYIRMVLEQSVTKTG